MSPQSSWVEFKKKKKKSSFISLLHLASSLNYTATFLFQTSCKSIWNSSLIQLKVVRRSQLYTEVFWDSFQALAVLAEDKYNAPSVCLNPKIWYKCSRCKSHVLAGCTEYKNKREREREKIWIFTSCILALEERLCQIPSIELLKAHLEEPKVADSHFFGFFIFLFGQTALKLSDHESSFMGWRGQIEKKKKSLFRNNVFCRLPSADPLNSSRVQAAQAKKIYRKQTSCSLNLTLMDWDP